MNNDARRRAIKYYALFMLLSALLAIVGGVLFFIAPSALPNSYIELSGQIVESRAFKNPASYGPDNIHDIRFRVSGSHLYFSIPTHIRTSKMSGQSCSPIQSLQFAIR